MVRAFRNKLQSRLSFAALVSLLLSACILTIRSTGIIESLELSAYDWLFRLRPASSGISSPIVLITVVERDIQKLANYPIPDSTLATALTKLMMYDPRAIGVDIYRDVTVPPGSQELEELFKKNGRIIGVMKFGGMSTKGIQPPPAMDRRQVGFSDILIDRDGVVRRALLFLDDGKTTVYSFDLRLALLYLEALGIMLQPEPSNPEHMRLGRTTIPPLKANGGGYVRNDARGYQFLLDFKDAGYEFPSYTLTALLSENIEADVFTGKIVLVGVTAESVPHKFFTPLSGVQTGDSISGLALHANIISQLLRAALEGNPPIKTLGELTAASWAVIWGLLGGIAGLRMRSVWRFVWITLGGLLLLGLCAYVAFLYAWWIPLVPPILNWLASATLITVYVLNEERRQARTWSRLPLQALTSTIVFADLIDSNAKNYRMRVGVYEKSDEREKTLRPYEHQNLVWSEVEAGCREIVRLLNQADISARVRPEILSGLKKTGQVLFELLLPQKAREKLYSSQNTDLILNIDEKLVGIPWELLFDGREFLSRRFAIGRIVTTRQVLTARSERILKPPFKVLVLADPEGDLNGSYSEGMALREFLDDRREMFRVDSKMRSINVAFVKKELRDYDIIHYAGHADYNVQSPCDSGWRLTDGRLTASEITAMGGLRPMPSLVFSHGCQTGQTKNWQIEDEYEQQIFGLANAYLVAGVQHYIGTFWDIPDKPSSQFAKSFYKFLAEGEKIGEAVRRTRQELIEAYGEETIVWASYMLYGDPTFSFMSAQAS